MEIFRDFIRWSGSTVGFDAENLGSLDLVWESEADCRCEDSGMTILVWAGELVSRGESSDSETVFSLGVEEEIVDAERGFLNG